MLPGLGSDFTNSVLFTAFSTAKLVAGIESCVKYVVCKQIQDSVKVGASMFMMKAPCVLKAHLQGVTQVMSFVAMNVSVHMDTCISDFDCRTCLRGEVLVDAVADAPCKWTLIHSHNIT